MYCEHGFNLFICDLDQIQLAVCRAVVWRRCEVLFRFRPVIPNFKRTDTIDRPRNPRNPTSICIPSRIHPFSTQSIRSGFSFARSPPPCSPLIISGGHTSLKQTYATMSGACCSLNDVYPKLQIWCKVTRSLSRALLSSVMLGVIGSSAQRVHLPFGNGS